MPYRVALPASPPSTEPTFRSLLRAAWRRTWSRWLLVAVLLAGGLVGWEVFYRFAVLPLAFATATYKLATDAMFDEWASWVPNLEDVRWRTTSVIALLGAGVISVSLLLAPVLGRLYVAMGGSPVDPMSSAERVSGYLVLAVLAFVYGALPPVLRWRLPKG